jgi:hypothetical protein
MTIRYPAAPMRTPKRARGRPVTNPYAVKRRVRYAAKKAANAIS